MAFDEYTWILLKWMGCMALATLCACGLIWIACNVLPPRISMPLRKFFGW